MSQYSEIYSNQKLECVNALPQQSLLSTLIATEFEKLGISKKYTGFKYLVQFLQIRFSNRLLKLNYSEILGIIANLNNSARDIIDHDIRHILSSSWKNSNKIKSITQEQNMPGAKQILYILIDYVQKLI